MSSYGLGVSFSQNNSCFCCVLYLAFCTHTQQLAHQLPCCKFPLAYPIPQNKNQKKKKEKKRKFKKKQNILNAVLLSECHLACNFCDARRRRRSGSGCLQTERLPHVARQQLAGERL